MTSDGAFLVRVTEQFSEAVLREDRGDLAAASDPMRPRALLRGLGSLRHGPPGRGLPVSGDCIDDNYGALSIVADSVGHVPEEKFAAAGHSGVADDQYIDRLLLGRPNDSH